MPFVIQRTTDRQFRTKASRWSAGPRWTISTGNARVFGRKSDATQAIQHDAEMSQRHCKVVMVGVFVMEA